MKSVYGSMEAKTTLLWLRQEDTFSDSGQGDLIWVQKGALV